MNSSSSRSRGFAPWLAAAGLAVLTLHSPVSPWLGHALAQGADPVLPSTSVAPAQAASSTTDVAPSSADSRLATDMVENKVETPRFAPPGTFYLLKYTSVKTDKGVEGFLPGEEVKLVEVHRDTQTLVVTNGRAQVEVPPIDLTNDRTIAASARAKDQAGQAQITAYQQAQQAAYNRYQQILADRAAEAKQDALEARRELAEAQRDTAKERREAQEAARDTAVASNGGNNNNNVNANNVNPGFGYYDNGGDGYGTAFAYFAGASVANAANAARPAPAVPAPASKPPGNVVRPAPAAPAAPVAPPVAPAKR